MQEHAIRFEKNDVVVYVVLKAESSGKAAEQAVELLKHCKFELIGAEPSTVGT